MNARGNVFARYFASLAAGDPVALGLTAVLVLIAAGLGLVVWFVSARAAAEERRHQQKLKRFRGY